MINRYPINIIHRLSKKSIQSDKYWLSYTVGRVILTEKTHRQKNKQTKTLFHTYNKKKIFICHKRLNLFSRIRFTYTHYIDTNTQYRAAPRRPPQTKYLQTDPTHKRTNKRQHFPRQQFLREGSRLVRGGSSRPIRRRHFPMYCY